MHDPYPYDPGEPPAHQHQPVPNAGDDEPDAHDSSGQQLTPAEQLRRHRHERNQVRIRSALATAHRALPHVQKLLPAGWSAHVRHTDAYAAPSITIHPGEDANLVTAHLLPQDEFWIVRSHDHVAGVDTPQFHRVDVARFSDIETATEQACILLRIDLAAPHHRHRRNR